MSATSVDDGRTPCVLFLTCVGAGPKYFLQCSDDFRRRYRIIPYMFNDIRLLPNLLPEVEREFERRPLIIYHHPDCLPYLGQYRERYDEFVERIPPELTRISIPQPGFSPFWPFHCGDPRNADDNRPRNRFGHRPVFPYGDSHVLRLLNEGLPPEEVIERYLKTDLSTVVDLDRLLRSALTMLERQDRCGPVKVAGYVADTFRSHMLFQTVNHANNLLFFYITNQVLKALDCAPVPGRFLSMTTEIVERPMPVHPSLGRYYGAGYLDESTRYPIDDVRNLTFAEYIRDYVYYANGLFNYADGLVNHPEIRLSSTGEGSVLDTASERPARGAEKNEPLPTALNDHPRSASPPVATAADQAEARPVPLPKATAPRLPPARGLPAANGAEADFQTAPVADIIKIFVENGSVLLRNFAEPARLLELRRVLDGVYSELKDVHVYHYHLLERGLPDIIDFIFSPKHRELLDALFDEFSYKHRALARRMQPTGLAGAVEPWQQPLSPHIDAFFHPLPFTTNFWVPLQPCGSDAPSLGVVRTPFAHVLDYVGYRDEGPVNLPAPELNFARFNALSRKLFEGDSAAVEAFRTRFAARLFAPDYELGDAMMLSNWTLHFTHSQSVMQRRRENVEIRLTGPATLQQILQRHAQGPSAGESEAVPV